MNAARLVAPLALVTLAGCLGGDVDSGASDIIGGVDASSPRLDAVGAMGTKDADGAFDYFCTATLIGPKAVLTAKHCATSAAGETPRLAYEKIYFAVGADSHAPKQVVQAVNVLLSPLDEGGMVDFGSDVAVYILAEPVKDVTPMPWAKAHLSGAEVGKKFAAVGYGVQDRQRTSGTRKAGTLTLQAVEGQPMHRIFPTREAFDAHMAKHESQAWIDANKTRLDELYDLTLLAGHEAYLGMGPGDAQPCSGDSGGPLVATIDGKLTVVAVVSGSFKGASYPCSTVGEVYATLGEKAQPMIDSATGPCEGVSVEGHCDAFTTAVRCVAATEGPQQVTRTDCSILGQACGIVEGKAACVDAP
ncbi:MAG: trypsin-like serine protease [Deltaproteobacteria bacterium]|nr:trypsin-like serine protease [Deltaproteobacteria bacterium]